MAKDIEPLEIQEWIDGLSRGLRSKIRSMMSAVYNHGQEFGMIPRSEGSNPIKWVSATTASDYEAVSLSLEESFAILERIRDLSLPKTPSAYIELSPGESDRGYLEAVNTTVC